jgi:hypothetical protein
MAKKGTRAKKFDVRKRRQKLIKERKIHQQKKEVHQVKKDNELDLRLKKETNLYWIRVTTGALSALFGRLIGLVGWSLFIWMLCFWLLFPFFVNFVLLRYKYDKEEWNWKNILMPGIGIFFFLFMIVGVTLHTFLVFVL